jgi:sugar phosphate isomerase/epimerase
MVNGERPVLISVVQYQTQLETGAMTIMDVIGKAVAHGVDGVELRREVWPAYRTEVPAARRRIEDAGLLVTFGTFSTLFNTDAAVHELLLEDIATAAALGAPLVRVFPGATPAAGDSAGWDRGREAVARAAELGVQIALENYARTPGGTLAEVSHILETIDSPALRTNIDIGNYPLHGQDVVAAIEAIGDKAIYSHIKDFAGPGGGAAVGLGEGVSPLADIFAALNRLPQRIILCFEFTGGSDPDARIRASLAVLRAHGVRP